ncbi:MAG: hypothetical protein DRI36_01205, partial [Caldiserica bacterium]
MAISEVKKIYIMGLKKDEDRVITFLQEKGCIEVSDAVKEFEKKEEKVSLKEIEDSLNKIKFILNSLGVDIRRVSLRGRGEESFEFNKIYEELKTIDDEIRRIENEKRELLKRKEILKNFLSFDFPFIYLKSLKEFRCYLVEIRKREIEKFKNEISKIPFKFYEVAKKEKGVLFYWVVVSKDINIEEKFNVVLLPDIEDSPKKEIEKIDKRLKELEKEKQELNLSKKR